MQKPLVSLTVSRDVANRELTMTGSEHVPERIFNLFVFVNESTIYEIGAVSYEIGGSDDEKVKFLRSRVDADFKTASRFPVPGRYLIKDSRLQGPVAALRYDKFKILMRMSQHLEMFDEIFRSLGAGSEPLHCITSVVDGKVQIDKVEEYRETEESEQKPIGYMEFHSPDYLVHYYSEGTFDLANLLNDDYLLAIKLLYNNNHYVSSIKLLMSFIDTVAYIEYGDVSRNFQQWLDKYVELATLEASADELWELRNSLLHMTNYDSRKVLKGKVQRLRFYVGADKRGLLNDIDEGKYVNLMALIDTILDGVAIWMNSYNSQPSKLKEFIQRYDRIVSDSRYHTAKIE